MNTIIVDDSRVIREKLKIILMQIGQSVIAEANGGKQAILLSRLLSPDVVTVDLNMGEMDGLETMEALKASDPSVRILIISSESDEDTINKLIERGADGYIVKPFDKESVMKAFEMLEAGRKS